MYLECVCEVTSGREMAGRNLRNRSITFVEDSIRRTDSNEALEINSFDNTAVNQGAETGGTVMSECEGNNADSTVTTEEGVGMSTRQLQDLLTALSTLRTDIVTIIETNNSKFQAECSNLRSDFLTITEQLDHKLQAAAENITAKIRQENEKMSEKPTQKLHNEVKKMSTDMCTMQNDTERKIQEITTTVGGVSVSLNERIDAHVVATGKITERISQETNGRARHLLMILSSIGQRQKIV